MNAMDYHSSLKDLVCIVCMNYGKVPVVHGLTRPVENWLKATTLLKKYEKSGWHLVAIERRAVNQSAQEDGNVVDIIVRASEEENNCNRELTKKLI